MYVRDLGLFFSLKTVQRLWIIRHALSQKYNNLLLRVNTNRKFETNKLTSNICTRYKLDITRDVIYYIVYSTLVFTFNNKYECLMENYVVIRKCTQWCSTNL